MTRRAAVKDRERQTRAASFPRRAALALILIFAALMLLSALDLDNALTSQRKAAQAIDDPSAPLASFYAPEVLYWKPQILVWAEQYGVNPNVLAIVIQIESCGNPEAISVAGAVGLMQVMPFHFNNGENMLNPDTNTARGMTVFYECLTVFADWNLGLALACYNGGPSVTVTDSQNWAQETQYYYRWATGLWSEVVSGEDKSKTLEEWRAAGGVNLCRDANQQLFPDV